MSKKGKKGNKKPDDANEREPMKARMQVIFDNYLQEGSLTLSQQKFIVSALSLRNDSLYDSIIIDVITDVLRFFKQLSLSAIQSEPVYYIVQNLLYKIMNDTSCNLDELTSYLHSQLLQRVKIENADQNDSDQSDEQSNEASTEYISSEISQEIICFLEERILSQYELYRVALFENNPSHIKYIKFKEEFAVEDIVRFQDEDCMFKIANFRSNDIILNCVHNDFKSIDIETENEKYMPVNYYISRDQLEFISFVSKTAQQMDVSEPVQEENQNEDSSNKENEETNNNQIQTKEEISNVDETCAKNNEEPERNVIKEYPKTLIDVIVDRKVQDKLKLMQQKFDKELEEYKQQIDKLNNSTQLDK